MHARLLRHPLRRLVAAVALAVAATGLLAAPARADTGLDPGDVAYVDVAVATLWTAPDEVRAVDAPATANPSDVRGWTAAMTLGQRVDLIGRLETQALYGTAVTVIERDGDWVHVAVHGQPTPRDERGYPGWVPARQLDGHTSFGRYASRPFALVTATTAQLYRDAALRHRDLELSLDTRLPVIVQAGRAVLVRTPDRGPRWLAARDLHVYRSAAAIPAPSGADLVATAKRFVGLHYLWAGTSALGFDCSGFTHTVYDVHGVTIPRDADAQFAAGTPVAKADLRPGDLVFYARTGGVGRVHHVGMYLGDGYEIDAPGNSATTESPLEIVKLDEHRYADEYAGARRFLG